MSVFVSVSSFECSMVVCVNFYMLVFLSVCLKIEMRVCEGEGGRVTLHRPNFMLASQSVTWWAKSEN